MARLTVGWPDLPALGVFATICNELQWVWLGRVSPMARNARGTPVDVLCSGSSGAWVGFGGPQEQRSGPSNHGRRLHFKTHVMQM